MSTAKPISFGIDKRKQTASRFLAFGLITFVVLVIGGLILFSTSLNSGEQFSVDGFQRRSFTYYEVLGYRISATTYFDRTGNLEQTLINKKWINDSGKKPEKRKWTTVTHSTSGSSYVGDAQILVNYLSMASNQGAIDLAAWSHNNPGYAKIMWPEIQTAAEGNMYILVPDILHHMLDLSEVSGNSIRRGKTAPKIEDLDKDQKVALIAQQTKQGTNSLYPLLKELYLEAAKAAQEGNDDARAKFCYQQVLRFSPESKEVQAELEKFPAELAVDPSSEEAQDTEDETEDESKQ